MLRQKWKKRVFCKRLCNSLDCSWKSSLVFLTTRRRVFRLGCNASQIIMGEEDAQAHSVHTHTQSQTALPSPTMMSRRRNYQRNDSPADLQRSPLISIRVSFLSLPTLCISASRSLCHFWRLSLSFSVSQSVPSFLLPPPFVFGLAALSEIAFLHLGSFFFFFFLAFQ